MSHHEPYGRRNAAPQPIRDAVYAVGWATARLNGQTRRVYVRTGRPIFRTHGDVIAVLLDGNPDQEWRIPVVDLDAAPPEAAGATREREIAVVPVTSPANTRSVAIVADCTTRPVARLDLRDANGNVEGTLALTKAGADALARALDHVRDWIVSLEGGR